MRRVGRLSMWKRWLDGINMEGEKDLLCDSLAMANAGKERQIVFYVTLFHKRFTPSNIPTTGRGRIALFKLSRIAQTYHIVIGRSTLLDAWKSVSKIFPEDASDSASRMWTSDSTVHDQLVDRCHEGKSTMVRLANPDY